MKTAVAPISLAGSKLGEVRHVCAFFNSDDEEYRVLLPFIKDGFECGDKAVHVLNPGQHQDHLQRLASVGLMRVPPSKADNSSFEPTLKHILAAAASIKIECCRLSSSWPAAMPRETFR
jgi:hypothetical protein